MFMERDNEENSSSELNDDDELDVTSFISFSTTVACQRISPNLGHVEYLFYYEY